MNTVRTSGHKAALSPNAAWSDKSFRQNPKASRTSAVVYVIANECETLVKLGHTRSIKSRIAELRHDAGEPLNICFWVDLQHDDAKLVERTALRLLFPDVQGRAPEWVNIPVARVAHAVIEAAHLSGVRIRAMAGFPGALDHDQNEIEAILSEAVPLIDRKGRLDREDWAPQAQSVRS